ncbi:Wzz/FepE/Etk N-terminal domain-containing protein [Piscinibacter gummiphilus]|uniref:Wzz/FepE/Etk N-terminal domain-containing protein n=1 Tax=Piscinibacter gummiphilus TaxID=946333 RepID=UPI0024E085DA|nr:Wzz/FepE/Etk N-terminal domain-containing protein [Piscinibacter gummiphilus]
MADDFDERPQVGFVDLLTWLGEGKKPIATVTAVAAVVFLGISLLLPNVYTARTTLLPANSQQQSNSSAALAALGSLGGLAGGLAAKTPEELYVNLLRSDSVQRALDARFDLRKRYDIPTYEVLRGTMPRYIRVTADKKSGVILVEVDDEDPKFAADLANAHSTEISKLLGRLAVSEAQQRRVFFEQQLKDTKENLIRAEQALRDVQEKSGMVVLDKQAEALILAVAQLKTRIAEREIRLKVLRTSATQENPEVRLLVSELAALRNELGRMESSNGGGTDKEGNLDIPIGKLPSTGLEYVRATREVKFQETLLAGMLRQYEIAKMDEAKEAPALQQVDVAEPPDRKSKPKRASVVLGGTFTAFLLMAGWTIWRRYGDLARARNPELDARMTVLRGAWRLRR